MHKTIRKKMANFETGCSLRNGRFYLEVLFFLFFFLFQFDIVIAFIITKEHNNDNKAKDKRIFNRSV